MARISQVAGKLTKWLVLGLLLVVEVRGSFSNECSSLGPIAHDTDCTKYYSCVGGRKVENVCPVMDDEGNRLHFNPHLHICDWPENAGCRLSILRLFRSKVLIPTECPKIDVGNHTVQLVHESDCTKYYMCSHGQKYEMQCPFFVDERDRLYFNPASQSCDWPENVNCKSSKAVKVVERFLRKGAIPTECPKLGTPTTVAVLLPHESDCTQFYICSNGQKYLMNCPVDANGDGLFFNVVLQTCDWRWNVDCTPTTEPLTTEPPTTVPPTTEPPTTEPPTTEPPTTEPPTTQPPTTEPPTTEPPTTEPPTTEPPTTEPPTTEPPTTEPPTTEPPTTEPPTTEAPNEEDGCKNTCPNNDPDNKITAMPHKDCRKWCRCQFHKIKVHICPANFHFSPKLKRCVKPELAGCVDESARFYRKLNEHDEALMNILRYNKIFRL